MAKVGFGQMVLAAVKIEVDAELLKKAQELAAECKRLEGVNAELSDHVLRMHNWNDEILGRVEDLKMENASLKLDNDGLRAKVQRQSDRALERRRLLANSRNWLRLLLLRSGAVLDETQTEMLERFIRCELDEVIGRNDQP